MGYGKHMIDIFTPFSLLRPPSCRRRPLSQLSRKSSTFGMSSCKGYAEHVPQGDYLWGTTSPRTTGIVCFSLCPSVCRSIHPCQNGCCAILLRVSVCRELNKAKFPPASKVGAFVREEGELGLNGLQFNQSCQAILERSLHQTFTRFERLSQDNFLLPPPELQRV